MKIAICDDDRNELLQIQTLLDLYAQERQMEFIVKEYHSSFELASAAANETFQIYLLDVLMPVLNGIDLAREIRLMDKAADILFFNILTGICCRKLYGKSFQLSSEASSKRNSFSGTR